jgi:hypothetical protein
MPRKKQPLPDDMLKRDASTGRPIDPTTDDCLRLGAHVGLRDNRDKCRRLALDVRQHANGSLGRLPTYRQSDQIKQLRALLEEIDNEPETLPPIREDLWIWIGAAEDYERDRLLSDRNALRRSIRRAIDGMEGTPELESNRKGGRNVDDRIDSFVQSLAEIYWKYAGKRPTITQDVETGDPVSPFCFFVEAAFEIFCSYDESPPGTLREAIRRAVEGERETECYDPPQECSISATRYVPGLEEIRPLVSPSARSCHREREADDQWAGILPARMSQSPPTNRVV